MAITLLLPEMINKNHGSSILATQTRQSKRRGEVDSLKRCRLRGTAELTVRLHKHAMSPLQPVEDDIRAIVDLETSAWDRLDADALVDLFHPDTVWPWPPNSAAHDPEHWVMPLGRFNRARWKAGWESLFSAYELVHNRRQTIRIQVSKEQDGAFAVVDVDTLWRHKETRAEQRWVGRSCKVYTKVNERWFFIHQTGLLEYTR